MIGSYNKFQFSGGITIDKNSWDPDLLDKSSQKCQQMMENVTVMVRFRFFLSIFSCTLLHSYNFIIVFVVYYYIRLLI